MNNAMHCPVCRRKLNVDHRIIDFGIECERGESCPCGYSYEYAYGAEREYFGPFEVRSSIQRWWLRWLWQVWTFDGCVAET